MMTWSQLGLQDSASSLMEEFIYFHDFTLLILGLNLSVVDLMLYFAIPSKWVNKNLLEGQALETFWTFMPAVVLVQLAIPSLMLLYLTEDLAPSHLIYKVMGHQWYWTNEMKSDSHDQEISCESYIVSAANLAPHQPRLLSTDENLAIPVNVRSRILVSSNDVLHSWAIPALGIKADAVPGRLNQMSLTVNRLGVFFGQCSEICGANHSFMPIVLEAKPVSEFFSWMDGHSA